MKKKYQQLLSCGLLILALGIGFSGRSQTTTYAVGTSTSSSIPVYGYYGYTYSEQIYLATDFDVAVQGELNQITTIRFYLDGTSLTNTTDWTIYMGQTTATDFPSTSSWITSNGMTQVFSGTIPAPAVAGWQEIVLTTPFTWDGVSNVVVGVDENQTGYGSNAYWRRNSTGANRSIVYYDDSNNPDPANPPSAISRYSYVPQVQFEHVLAPGCSGTPSNAGLTASSLAVCEGETVDFELETPDFANGFTILWQYNTGSGWTDFPTSTSSTLFSTVVNQSMDVRAIRTCTASGLFDESDVVSITMNTLPTVAVDVSEAVFCSGSSVTINATGAATYSWSPSTGLNNAATPTVSANPTANTLYTVTGTDANGCIATATSLISQVGNVQLSATSSPGLNCAPGSPITIDTDISPSTLSSGTWEYRFLGSDGVTVLQNWNSTSSYNFIPTVDSVYNVYYQARNTGCSDYIDSVLMSVVIGFGAEVTVIDYDCINLEGSIILNNVFGQTNESIIYENLLDAVTPELTFTGNASINGGRAVITPSQTSAAGAMDVNIPGFSAGVNNALKVSFDLTADTPINTWGTGGGDGIAYSFGNDALASGAGPNANGKGSKLRLSFDAADNSPNQAGIYLVYGYTGTTNIPVNDPSVIAFSPNLSSWKILADVPVELSIDQFGRATVTVGTEVIFDQVQLPASYLTEDVSNWRHLFSAHTGGDALRHAISNLSIEAPTLEMAVVPTGVTPGFADFDMSNNITTVQPGMYDVWIAQDSTNTCSRMIGTYEVLNTNPVVDLGNDTTICEGEVLILDAGNPGSTYTWSGTNEVTQTIAVSSPGTYVAYATAANSCLGIGTINVDVIGTPSVSGIYAQGNFPTLFLSATNPQNVAVYDWDFGDGTVAMNGPSSLSHAYLTPGTYTVTLTISNDCGSEVITETVEVANYAGLDEQALEGVEVYPNPASEFVTIKLPENLVVDVKIMSMTGAVMTSLDRVDGIELINVKDWEAGMYFVQVLSEGLVSTTKVVVQ